MTFTQITQLHVKNSILQSNNYTQRLEPAFGTHVCWYVSVCVKGAFSKADTTNSEISSGMAIERCFITHGIVCIIPLRPMAHTSIAYMGTTTMTVSVA